MASLEIMQKIALLRDRILQLHPQACRLLAEQGIRISHFDHPQTVTLFPSGILLGIIVQGSASVFLHAREYPLEAGQSMAVRAGSLFRVSCATVATSVLVVSFPPDPCLLSRIMETDLCICGHLPASIADVDVDMLDALLRLFKVTDCTQLAVFAPMILEELQYRALNGEHGSFLRSLHATATGEESLFMSCASHQPDMSKPAIAACSRWLKKGASSSSAGRSRKMEWAGDMRG